MAQVAEACCAGEPPAKRARGDEPDWTAKLNKAETDYDEAKQEVKDAEKELKAEFQKDPQQRDQHRIKFLQEAMQNSQQRLEFAQKDKEMLLQAQSQQSEAQQGRKYLAFPK